MQCLASAWRGLHELTSLPLFLPSPHPPDAPALLDSMRRGLVPLVRQGRRGPALDLDAFLLVVLEEYSDGGQGSAEGLGMAVLLGPRAIVSAEARRRARGTCAADHCLPNCSSTHPGLQHGIARADTMQWPLYLQETAQSARWHSRGT